MTDAKNAPSVRSASVTTLLPVPWAKVPWVQSDARRDVTSPAPLLQPRVAHPVVRLNARPALGAPELRLRPVFGPERQLPFRDGLLRVDPARRARQEVSAPLTPFRALLPVPDGVRAAQPLLATGAVPGNPAPFRVLGLPVGAALWANTRVWDVSLNGEATIDATGVSSVYLLLPGFVLLLTGVASGEYRLSLKSARGQDGANGVEAGAGGLYTLYSTGQPSRVRLVGFPPSWTAQTRGGERTPLTTSGVLDLPSAAWLELRRPGGEAALYGASHPAGSILVHYRVRRYVPGLGVPGVLTVLAQGQVHHTWGGQPWVSGEPYPALGAGYELFTSASDNSLLAYEPQALPGQSYAIGVSRFFSGDDRAQAADTRVRCRAINRGVWTGIWSGQYAQDQICDTGVVASGPKSVTVAEGLNAQEARLLKRARLYRGSDVLSGTVGRTLTHSRNAGQDNALLADSGARVNTSKRAVDALIASEAALKRVNNHSAQDAFSALDVPADRWTPARLSGADLGNAARYDPAITGVMPLASVLGQTLTLTAASNTTPYAGMNGFLALTLPEQPWTLSGTLQAQGGNGASGAGLSLTGGAGELASLTQYDNGYAADQLLGSPRSGYLGGLGQPFRLEQTAGELILTVPAGQRRAAHLPERARLRLNLQTGGGRAAFTLLVTGLRTGVARNHPVSGQDAGATSESRALRTRGGSDALTSSDAASLRRGYLLSRFEAGAAQDSGLRRSNRLVSRDQGSAFDSQAVRRLHGVNRAEAFTAREQAALSRRGAQEYLYAQDNALLNRQIRRRGVDPASGSDAGQRGVNTPRARDAALGRDTGRMQPSRFTRADTAAGTERALRQSSNLRGQDAGAASETTLRRRLVGRTASDAASGQDRGYYFSRGGQELLRGGESGLLKRGRRYLGPDAGAFTERGQQASSRPSGADAGAGLDNRTLARVIRLLRADTGAALERTRLTTRGSQEVGTLTDAGAVRRGYFKAGQETSAANEAGRVLPSRITRTEAGSVAERATLARRLRLSRQDAASGSERAKRHQRGAEETLTGLERSGVAVTRRLVRTEPGTGSEGRVLRRNNNSIQDQFQGDASARLDRRRLLLRADYGAFADRGFYRERGGEERLLASESFTKRMRNTSRLIELTTGRETARVQVNHQVPGADTLALQDAGLRKRRGVQETLSGTEGHTLARRANLRRLDSGLLNDAPAGQPNPRTKARVTGLDNATPRDSGTLRRVRTRVGLDAGRLADRSDFRPRGGDEFLRGTERAALALRSIRLFRTDTGGLDDGYRVLGQPKLSLRAQDRARSREAAKRASSRQVGSDSGRGQEAHGFPVRTFTAQDGAAFQDGGRIRNGTEVFRAGEVLATPREWTWRPELAVVPGPAALGDTSQGAACSPWTFFVTYFGTPYMARGDFTLASWADAEAQLIKGVPDFAFHLSLAFDQNAERVAAWTGAVDETVHVSWVELNPGRIYQLRSFRGVDPLLFCTARLVPLASGTDTLLFYLNPERTKVFYRQQVEQYRFEYEYARLPVPGVFLDQVFDDGSSVLLALGDAERTRTGIRVGPYPRFLTDKAVNHADPDGGRHFQSRSYNEAPPARDSAFPLIAPDGGYSWRAANRAGSAAWLDLSFAAVRTDGGLYVKARTFVDTPVLQDNLPYDPETQNPNPDVGRAALTNASPDGGRGWMNTFNTPLYTDRARNDAPVPAGGFHKENL